MSGTTTPASNSIPDSTPGTSWADDGEPAGSTNPPSHRRDVGSTPDDPTLTPKNDDADTAASAGTPRAHAASLTAVTTVDSSKKPDGEDHSRQSHNQSMAAEVSTSVEAADVPAPQDAVKSADAIDGPSKEDTTPKLAYQEARPPPVNPWLQRAADAKAKAAVHPVAKSTAVSGSRDIGSASVDQRRKSEAPHPRDSRRNDARPRDDFRNGRQRQDQRVDEGATSAQRKGASRARDRASSEAGPPPRAEISWPKPMDAHDEDRKKTHDPSDKTEKDRSGTNAGKGKPEWKVMPYTPTAVFETQITGKGSGRMGKGAARGVPTGSGRGPVGPASATNGTGESSKPSERVSPLSNGETSTPDKAGTGKAEGDVPSASGRIVSETPQDGRPIEPRTTVPSEPADTTAKDLDSGIASTLDDTTRPAPAARRNKSPRRSDAFVRRTGSVHDSTGRRFSAATHSEDTANLPVNGELPASRSAFADRRSETQSFDSGRDVPPFREGKRGGRKGGRGGFNNAQFGSPHGYNNGYPDYQNGNHSPGVPFSPRAGHYSQGSRSGYRNQGMRAQSIPVDAFGRSVPYGYPMMPMQPMMPDYYNSFSPGSHGFQSQSEREMLVTSVAMQVEYYFSIDNLLKDIFLRKHMDSQGWIFLSVVAEFNRLKTFTTDYEVLKQACLQSREVEIRVADDGKDRLRKVGEWQRWVLPVEDRDALAQGESPSNLRRPSAPRVHSVEQAPIFYPASPASAQFSSPYGRTDRSFQIVNGGPPPFYPSGSEQRHNDYSKPEESRGRQPRFAHHRESSNVSPLTNGHPSTTEASGEPDKFPSSQIEGLTVVVRKHDLRGGAPFHSASSRTFSNGSIDSRSIMEEVSKPQVQASKVNGVAPSERLVHLVRRHADPADISI